MHARRLLTGLLVLGAVLLLSKLERPASVPTSPGPPALPSALPSASVDRPSPATGAGSTRSSAASALQLVGDPRTDAQIALVVRSLDETGAPPAGVAQGGRGGRGVFQNAEGRLPRRPPGYYTESDVWPRGRDGRGAVRLVVGREGEVYYSADHYRSFRRLR
jgi:guanyl-specific ribonuclease Sa